MAKSKTILLVEDDLDDREFLLDAIRKVNADVQIEFAGNGFEALQFLTENRRNQLPQPGLIVLDLNLPFLNGRETFVKLREDAQFSKVPVIIFTSSLNPNDRDFFTRYGVEYITKPYDFGLMKGIVQRMLEAGNSSN
jgi:CheY-like chemotaxis protein